MMKFLRLKVILDTNVLLSAVLFGGKPKVVLNMALSGLLSWYMSDEGAKEFIEKLKYKFLLSEEDLVLTSQVLNKAIFLRTINKLHICIDPKDNFLFELAEVCDADYILSNDKRVLEIGKYKNTKILKVNDFLLMISNQIS